MRSSLRVLGLVGSALPILGLAQDCVNQSQYPSVAIQAPAVWVTTGISTCNFQEEYSRITGVVAGATYLVTVDVNTYVTARQGTFDGPVTVQGYAPLTIVAPTGDDLFLHWNVDDACNEASECIETAIQRVADCQLPVATGVPIEDCENNEFSVDVDITGLGDGGTNEVDLSYTVNGGAPTTISGVGLGVTTVGPFAAGATVNITIHHGSDAQCDLVLVGFMSENCPIVVDCTVPEPLSQTYCYTDNDSENWIYSSSDGLPLAMIFSAGTIESSTFDELIIRNGTDNNAPVLFEHTQTSQFNLADLMVIAPSGSIYMEMSSDGSSSCSSGSQTSWAWVVGCMDCTPPTVTYSVELDCANDQFFAVADVTSLGSDNMMELTNSAGAPAVTVNAPGEYQTGPYPLGTNVVLTLENDANNLCSVASATLTNSICPLIIDCDAPQVNETFCYDNNASQQWYYQSSTGQSVALIFNAGTIESSSWDHITITDGPGGAVLFDHTGFSQLDLTGTLAVSGADGIYMFMTSDGSSSCSSGSQTQWSWTVGCLDCTSPEAEFEVVEDCVHRDFYIAVDIPNTGSSSTVRIANSQNTDTLSGVQTGQTLVGPFPMGTNATVTVLNSENDLCRVISPSMTAVIPDCVIPSCAAAGYEYCYANNDTAWFVFQSSTGDPITIHFDWGQLLVTDYIQIFNGLNEDAQMIYMGNMGGNLAGLAINSNNPDDAICMRIISNWTGSCQDGQAAGAYFVVECGMVGMEEVPESQFDLFPNPTNGEVSVRLPAAVANGARILVTDLVGRQVHAVRPEHLVNGAVVLDLADLAAGMYTVTVLNGDYRSSRQLQVVR